MFLGQNGTNEALNTVNLVVTGVVSVILAWLAAQRNRDKKQADQRHEAAVAERQVIAEKAEVVAQTTAQVAAQVQPTNGYDTLGEALDGLEKRVNEMGERLARGDHRFDNMERNEQRIAEQLAVVAGAVDRLVDKVAEVLALQADARDDARVLARSVLEHHEVWDDPDDTGTSLLEWVEQAKLRDEQTKRKKGRT